MLPTQTTLTQYISAIYLFHTCLPFKPHVSSIAGSNACGEGLAHEHPAPNSSRLGSTSLPWPPRVGTPQSPNTSQTELNTSFESEDLKKNDCGAEGKEI